MKVNKLLARKENYSSTFIRPYRNVKKIVIHYTSNRGDTALGNATYFAREILKTSAHYFIDRNGIIYKSVCRNRVAWHAGNWKMNLQSIGIELCDIVDKPVSAKQKKALKWLVESIKKQCTNVDDVIRHYDVTKKNCPLYYVQHGNEWVKLRNELLKEVR